MAPYVKSQMPSKRFDNIELGHGMRTVGCSNAFSRVLQWAGEGTDCTLYIWIMVQLHGRDGGGDEK